MRNDLLKILYCPVCHEKNLSLKTTGKNKNETREGFIECRSCNKKYKVEEGIVNFLVKVTPEIISEQKGWTKLEKAVKNTDELMLSLPEGIGERREEWRSQAKNFNYMFSKLGLSGREVVLDLGAGRCWSTSFFAEKGCYSVGLDILLTKYVGLLTSDIYIDNKGVYFERVMGDMDETPFRDQVFDIVFITATLHHSLDLSVTLKEVYRVLRPGGRMVLINEPVAGLFRRRTLDCAEVQVGINEHVHKLWSYLCSVKRTGMKYTIYKSIGSHFRLIDLLKYLLSLVLRKKSLYKRSEKILNYLKLLIFGGILNIIAVKS
jgi:ubiquinone/menaquinone biosynthesis C-methylase UbiE/uncharacterized protein YbaR (Trm112 family)